MILTTLSDFSVQLFAIASMASIGFRYSVGEIVGPLHRFWAVIVALVANFVAVPLLAFVILHVIKLDPAYAIGLVLVAAAAGAPMIIKLTEMSGGDVAFSAGLLVLLIVVSIVYMPLVVPLLSPGSEISPWAIANPLVLTMLLPLAVGLLVKRLAPTTGPNLAGPSCCHERVPPDPDRPDVRAQSPARNWRPRQWRHSRIANVHRWRLRHRMGVRWRVRRALRDEMALGTSQRNFAAALVVATQSFDAPGVVVMAVVVSLVTMAVLFPAAKLLNRHAQREGDRRVIDIRVALRPFA